LEKKSLEKKPLEKKPLEKKPLEKKPLEQKPLETISKDTIEKKATEIEPKNIIEEDTESAIEALKKIEIRSGIQTVESTRDPESVVAVAKEAVLQERVKPTERIEIQPVIHRQREQMEVHQINENISQTEVLPTVFKEKELPAQFVGEFREDDKLITEKYLKANSEIINTMEVDDVKRIRIVNEPIVEEHVHKTIVEVVQPIIHKETIAPVVIRETLPLYEKVIEAPTMSLEERSVDLGVKIDRLEEPQIKRIIEKDIQKENLLGKEKNLELTKEIEKIAKKKGCNAAQLCLAWVMAQGDDFIPIPGTTSIKNLESNLASLSVSLSQDDLNEIRKVISSIPIEGTRYPAEMMIKLNK